MTTWRTTVLEPVALFSLSPCSDKLDSDEAMLCMVESVIKSGRGSNREPTALFRDRTFVLVPVDAACIAV